MSFKMSEVLQFVEENDVKFIRLAFCDIFGIQKNISISPSELPRAFKTGISFDAHAIDGFTTIDKSDLFLFPDPATLSILPWRPSHGRVVRFFCDIKYPDGRAYEGDCRNILKQAVKKAEDMGYVCRIGSECEFYLFEMNELGEPTFIPQDNAAYFDIAPLDKGENVRREICLTLDEMNIKPESSHHEQGPGQNEIDFKHNTALESADNLITFKSVVKTIAARNGLYASFMPKPFLDKSGNGMHINLSLSKNGINIFKNDKYDHSPDAESFMAGILNKILDITAFLNPTTNSYKRFGEYEAPKYVTWSHQNRSQLIRIPAETGELSRMELRSPDPSCNPYLSYALLIYAGLYGIENNIVLPQSCDYNIYDLDSTSLSKFEKLHSNLKEALDYCEKSEFVSEHIPECILKKYFSIKNKEWDRYTQAESKEEFEKQLYFNLL